MIYRILTIFGDFKYSNSAWVFGDAAYYVNPYDVDDIARGIEKVLTDENLRQTLIKKGFENVKRFSWESSAKKIVKVINNINH